MAHKIFFVSSQKISVVVFLLPHLRSLVPLHLISVFLNDRDEKFLSRMHIDVPVFFVPIERSINLVKDIKGLFSLYRFFRNGRPQAVHSVTPKAGLLAMTAAWLAHVPVRVHTFTGQVWVTRSGPMRSLLKMGDRCIAYMATNVLVDSPSQRAFLIEQGIVSAQRSMVLGSGSICGVDTLRFFPSKNVREAVREELGTSSNTLVCLYLGRLNRDKGVLDLASAFAKVAKAHPRVELWVVGSDEANLFKQMKILLGDAIHKVKRVNFTLEPERFMQAADLFCLPSYREGFGSSVIESAACGVPALVSRIYGLTDAVKEGQTGWMHEPGNVADIVTQLKKIITSNSELKLRGQAARLFVKKQFDQVVVTKAMLDFYKQNLK